MVDLTQLIRETCSKKDGMLSSSDFDSSSSGLGLGVLDLAAAVISDNCDVGVDEDGGVGDRIILDLTGLSFSRQCVQLWRARAKGPRGCSYVAASVSE